MNPCKLILSSLFILFSYSSILAQDLTDDWDFLHQARGQYEQWLEGSELGKILRVTDLQIYEDLVILDLRAPNGNDWTSFKSRYQENFGADLRRKLFQKMVFLFELDRDQAGLRIRTDLSDHYVDMRYKSDTLILNETVRKDVPRNDSLYIDFNNISCALVGNGAASIELTKSKLRQFFEQYYQNKSKPYREVQFDIYDSEPSHLSFVIWNLKKEILNDFSIGYFERILLDLTFKAEGEGVKVYYEVFGSFGSGIFKAPRKSNYTDIDLEYDKAYLDDYQRRIKNKINDHMKK